MFRVNGNSPKRMGDLSVFGEYAWEAGHLGGIFVVVIRKTNCMGRESQQ